MRGGDQPMGHTDVGDVVFVVIDVLRVADQRIRNTVQHEDMH